MPCNSESQSMIHINFVVLFYIYLCLTVSIGGYLCRIFCCSVLGRLCYFAENKSTWNITRNYVFIRFVATKRVIKGEAFQGMKH